MTTELPLRPPYLQDCRTSPPEWPAGGAGSAAGGRAGRRRSAPGLAALALLVLFPATVAWAQNAGADGGDEQAPKLDTWHEKASYALGMNMGANLDLGDLELDADLLLRGFLDAVEGRQAMGADEAQGILMELHDKMQAYKDKAREAAFLENTARGEAFLATKEKQDGVMKTGSGLLYREIRAGRGESPTADQQVTVHYRGTLIDGTEFDSSYARDQPMTFPVGRVIPGWVEALQLMQPGAHWELIIPQDLGYGRNGSPPDIPPGATLVFEVELLSVE